MKLSRGKQPPGLWHFEVAPGVRLEGPNEEELVKRIFEYRLRNNVPIGDIERDIDTYYCSRWPEACHREAYEWSTDGNGGNPNVSNFTEPLLNRVSRWAAYLLHLLPRGGMELVPKDEAARRGLICVGCAKNQSWRAGCRGCSSSTATALAQLRQLKSSVQHNNLNGCTVAGWDLQTAVWMPVTGLELTDAQKDSLPDYCWRRSL